MSSCFLLASTPWLFTYNIILVFCFLIITFYAVLRSKTEVSAAATTFFSSCGMLICQQCLSVCNASASDWSVSPPGRLVSSNVSLVALSIGRHTSLRHHRRTTKHIPIRSYLEKRGGAIATSKRECWGDWCEQPRPMRLLTTLGATFGHCEVCVKV